ncbi:E3 ubiquitin-protein ligase makorin-1 [Elysia marginata]|uniref:RING-type E3 ubiquitin transferase n=1 Tax=Elysia marginata TaxID=1093978 RepID=A0AAV4JFF9_9GAST|nr:E3 ubiquitin-protein ligase makorin-1 [Elysia marginata]
MADSGQAPEGNFATAATAPMAGKTNRSTQTRNSTTTTTHAQPPVREEIPPSTCRFPLRKRCRNGCRCSQFQARTVPSRKLCKYFKRGYCKFGAQCKYSHGQDSAEEAQSQRKRDEEQECGICFEKVLANMETSDGEMLSKFGILQNCNHCFCLSCIRQWRTTEGDARAMRKSCPVCRTPSEFIVPSKHWVETQEEKKKLIENFKKVLKSTPPIYFDREEGCFWVTHDEPISTYYQM